MSEGTNLERITQNNTLLEENNLKIQEAIQTAENLPDAPKSQYVPAQLSFAGYMGTDSIALTNAFTKLDLNNITNTAYMFYYCRGITSLDLADLILNNIIDMQYMFAGCMNLTNLTNLNVLNTSNTTNMNSLFTLCQKLTALDLSTFNTSNVTNMGNMFNNCRALTSLDLSNFNTSKVTLMQLMFINCIELTSIDLSSFDTSKVANMMQMFAGCSKLSTIPELSTVSATNMTRMFMGCNNLSEESLNNILVMCTNATKLNAVYKTLKEVGLTTEQATICQSLSNYQAFLDAGWTTGY